MTSSSKSKSHAENSSLKITIKGCGLGLNEDGVGSLIARNMDDYMKVAEFACSSMQADGIGIVQGIGIIHWVDNPHFQVAAGISDIVPDYSKETSIEGEPEKCTSVSSEIKKMSISTNGEYVATVN